MGTKTVEGLKYSRIHFSTFSIVNFKSATNDNEITEKKYVIESQLIFQKPYECYALKK